ncbi:hypothetical protein BJ138DRAFT_1019274, partial [Hygrophoropsis aurantiaca]
MTDPECTLLPGRAFTASALRNLAPSSSHLPDLVLHHGSDAVSEYDNPALMPGMFPTLFPFGIGGFDDKTRSSPLSFQKQAQYYFNIADKSFRYHHSFMFVALNIIQRRTAHLHTHFTVRRSHFDSVARELTSVSASTLSRLADQLQHERKYSDLTPDDRKALNLLKHVNTIAARVPGSQASKMFARSEIRNYFGYFGMPHIYFTCNPSPAHSPIFQVMSGDQTVDLSKRFPTLVPSRERALRLAKDPVAAADFFEFSVTCLFEYLFRWDYSRCQSSANGGILGHIRAFYGTSE